MTRRERWIFSLVLLAGLGLIGMLAVREDRAVGERQERELARRTLVRLEAARAGIGQWTDQLRDSLEHLLAKPDNAMLQSLPQTQPLVTMGFRTVGGVLEVPRTGADASPEERAFGERTDRLFDGRAVLSLADGTRREGSAPNTDGMEWIPWHWEDGLHILALRRLNARTSVGVEIDRIALLSRLAGEFEPADLAGGGLSLHDGTGRLLLGWGRFEADSQASTTLLGGLPLASPFETWSLKLRGPEAKWAADVRRDLRTTLVLRWTLIALGFLAVVFLVGREWTRALREARLRTGFVQQVSHELRTPLTNIRLHAELAREGTLEDDTYRHLEVVGQETERLSRLVSNILTFARAERGPLALHLGEADLEGLLREAIAPFAPFLERAQIELEWNAIGPLRARFEADAASQIVQNLLGNAVKYAAAGHWIGIQVEPTSRAWQVRFRDRGPGIPDAERETIFKPFYRLSNRITDGVAGTGIGLGIARDLARALGGDLILESGTNGCTFLWTVPRNA